VLLVLPVQSDSRVLLDHLGLLEAWDSQVLQVWSELRDWLGLWEKPGHQETQVLRVAEETME